jgi:hypothetical protein
MGDAAGEPIRQGTALSIIELMVGHVPSELGAQWMTG